MGKTTVAMPKTSSYKSHCDFVQVEKWKCYLDIFAPSEFLTSIYLIHYLRLNRL